MEEKNWLERMVRDVARLGELEVSDSLLVPRDEDAARKTLEDMIAFLIDRQFEKLLWILYRIDVDEAKAKRLLSEHLPEEAPAVLAKLIIERQRKKESVRAQFSGKAPLKEDEDLLL